MTAYVIAIYKVIIIFKDETMLLAHPKARHQYQNIS
ncbi:hypothetical protein DSUL_50463 [Desulfovibrionales bacterium]